MKIGIFGGTFNPPHKGHLRLCKDFLERLSLDKILIIPDKIPVHKVCDDLASNVDRVEMCKRAFNSEDLEISTMEIDRETDSYTVYTIRELKKMYPNDEIYLIVGSDMFMIFNKWYKYEEILENCTLCVASRCDEQSINDLCDYSLNNLGIKIENLKGENVIISPIEPFEVSSSLLRDKIKNHESTDEYLDSKVRKYIENRGLYGYTEK